MNTTTAEQRLRTSDIQPTAMRMRVLNFMLEYKSAISLTDLEEHFSRADRTTLYRTLKNIFGTWYGESNQRCKRNH